MIFKFHDTHVLRDAKIIDICEERITRRIREAQRIAQEEAAWATEQQKRWQEYKKTWLKPRLQLVPTELHIAGKRKPGVSER